MAAATKMNAHPESDADLISSVIGEAQAALADGRDFFDLSAVAHPGWADRVDVTVDRVDKAACLRFLREVSSTAVITQGLRFDIATGEVVEGGWEPMLVLDGYAEFTDLAAALVEIESMRAAVLQALNGESA